ncbi:hypothetical protein L3N51_01612 [Metallosphaera sp. J1]|uniref:helix-turn-helix domain-containing protein n=1 Tax=Metallosphaera javensis (ex Hofmann et al. 2022) TaxID=99938 RepID=UPI001EDCD857|nr:helix-turn-helix domain-containing protein [Metallosphaera javensis (ex Hofmann et al. 2022)]MCG3109322.1 hypothetical protein [Metallosphaera javensis (ex Hofmann et al. 2022)]
MVLKKVTIGVIHDGCWTSETEERAITMNLEVYPDKGYLRSWLVSPSRELGKRMASHRSVKKLNRVYVNRGDTLLDFLNVYEGSIAGLLYSKEVLILGNYNERGTEFWTFVTGSGTLSELKGELSSLGKIVRIEVEDFSPSYPYLTEMERKVFWMALNNGYLNYPREIEAEDLAKVLGVSKVTFLYHWRNAQRKILKYVSDHLVF